MFTFNYTIKQEDLNYGNHVGNERALLFFQWTREEFLRANNLSETDIGDGSGFIQTEATVQYKKQLFLEWQQYVQENPFAIPRFNTFELTAVNKRVKYYDTRIGTSNSKSALYQIEVVSDTQVK